MPLKGLPDSTSTTLYVHVPFCVVKCGYCDFNSYPVEDTSVVDRFLTALDLELRLATRLAAPPTVFIGGGTPTYLDSQQFERLFEILNEHVKLSACAEVSMEANPESLTLEKAKIAKAAGVNRVSIGVQSFHPDHLIFLDRAHDKDKAIAAYENVRQAGFDNVSLDLMFSIPGQTLEQWDQDLQQVVALGPDHLSCYNLTFEAGTKLTKAMKDGRVTANDDRLDRSLFDHTRTVLGSAGYDAYEISNFAGRGGPCLHNDHYWLQGDYLGVGPGAASHRMGWRGTNLKPVEAWASSIERGFLPTGDAEVLAPHQRAAEAIWLGLRRKQGIDLASTETSLGLPVHELFKTTIDRYAAMGWLELDGTSLRLQGEGLIFADAISEAFLTG